MAKQLSFDMLNASQIRMFVEEMQVLKTLEKQRDACKPRAFSVIIRLNRLIKAHRCRVKAAQICFLIDDLARMYGCDGWGWHTFGSPESCEHYPPPWWYLFWIHARYGPHV
ncbi:MAG: hypothetical protein WCI73_04020 [Phycisphaerae bacterium]